MLLKINIDGSFNPTIGEGGWGAIIRNSAGEVVRAGAGNIAHAMDAFHCEIIAAKEGIKMAEQAGMTRVILETDALLLKFALANYSFRLATAGGLIHEIKATIVSCFSSFSCVHCFRICNQVAHALAALGCKCPADSN